MFLFLAPQRLFVLLLLAIVSWSFGYVQATTQRNEDGEWGVPQNTLTIPAPSIDQGVYLIDIQDSYPTVDWDTLDRLYISGGEYKFLRIGNLPDRTAENPLIITNINGQVRVGGQEFYYLFSISGGMNWILTGKYDPISETGDINYPGHRDNTYENSRDTYGILIDDKFHKFGIGNSGIVIGSGVPMGKPDPPTTDFRVSFVEIRNVGFAGMSIKSDGREEPMNNVYIHDNYIHDTGSEGLYIGSTQSAPQHSFNNLTVVNNRVLRTGTEALQVGHLGDGCEIKNNVFALSAIDWKNAFQGFQDSSSQLGFRYGKNYVSDNIFIGAANTMFGFFDLEYAGDVHKVGDGMTIRDNFYSSFRWLGGFMGQQGGVSDTVSTHKLQRNLFRQFSFQRTEIYPNDAFPKEVIKVNAQLTNNIILTENVLGTTLENISSIVSFAGSSNTIALNGVLSNVTATGNKREPVAPVTFHDFMGLSEDIDYLLIERWTNRSSRANDALTNYTLGDYVMHKGNLYLCIEAGIHSDKDPLTNPETWKLLPTPGDDVRLGCDSEHQGKGLLDTLPITACETPAPSLSMAPSTSPLFYDIERCSHPMLSLASSSSQTDSVKLERKGRACEIASMEVVVDIIHTSVNDLQVSLEHDETTVMLLEDACSTSEPPTIEMGIRFDDTTRSVPVAKAIPETCDKPLVGRYHSYNIDGTSLLDFVGNLGQGTWTLNVTRNGSEGAEDGFLLSWTIGIACAAKNGNKSNNTPNLRNRG